MHLDKDDEMKFHIVGNGESIDDILNGYDITFDELKNENKHIRIWEYLIPGTKLKIPVLTESIIENINEIEPFIEDYYPKLKIQDDYENIIEEENNEFTKDEWKTLFIRGLAETENGIEVEVVLEEAVDVIGETKIAVTAFTNIDPDTLDDSFENEINENFINENTIR